VSAGDEVTEEPLWGIDRDATPGLPKLRQTDQAKRP